MAIQVMIEKEGEWTRVRFQGVLNEEAETKLKDIGQQLGPKVYINFGKIESINSLGVRAWIGFLRDAQKNRTIMFEECTPEVVSQMNMIPNFRGIAAIKSVYGQFICNSCNHSMNVLFEQGKNLPKSATDSLPPVVCPKCSSEMELAELDEEYLAWVDAA